jgi:hypothetical protein
MQIKAAAQGWRQSLKTTVEQTLMRGLDTAFPLFVRGCLYLPAGVDLGSATQFIRGFPHRGPVSGTTQSRRWRIGCILPFEGYG